MTGKALFHHNGVNHALFRSRSTGTSMTRGHRLLSDRDVAGQATVPQHRGQWRHHDADADGRCAAGRIATLSEDYPAQGQPSLLDYGASFGMMKLLYYTSLQTVPHGIAVALEFTGPLAIALLNSRRRSDMCWVGLAIVELATLLAMGQTAAKAIPPWGSACALRTGGCWADHILCGQRVGQAQGTTGDALGMTVAALAAIPLGIARAGINLASLDTPGKHGITSVALWHEVHRTIPYRWTLDNT